MSRSKADEMNLNLFYMMANLQNHGKRKPILPQILEMQNKTKPACRSMIACKN